MNKYSANQDNNRNNHKLESITCKIVSSIINTRYNWSIIVATIIIWSLSVFTYSSNSNFDMSVAINDHIRVFSLLAILVGFLQNTKQHSFLIKIGTISFLLSLFAIIMTKTLIMNGTIGVLLLSPLSIFCFLILVKNIWNIGVSSFTSTASHREETSNSEDPIIEVGGKRKKSEGKNNK